MSQDRKIAIYSFFFSYFFFPYALAHICHTQTSEKEWLLDHFVPLRLVNFLHFAEFHFFKAFQAFFEIYITALINHNLKLCRWGQSLFPMEDQNCYGCMDVSGPSLQVVYRLSALAHCTALVRL